MYNIKLGFRAKSLPYLGQSDHLSLLLITAPRTVKTWPLCLSARLLWVHWLGCLTGNTKRWTEVQYLHRESKNSFRSGDGSLYSATRANLRWRIREAKATYRRTASKATTPDRCGKRVKHITNYRPSNTLVMLVTPHWRRSWTAFLLCHPQTHHIL